MVTTRLPPSGHGMRGDGVGPMFSACVLRSFVPRDNPVPVRRLMHFSDVGRRRWKRRRQLHKGHEQARYAPSVRNYYAGARG